ncbi:MAG: hypothetical protein V1861_06290 [Candidatus Micrarchaeota archaeon]
MDNKFVLSLSKQISTRQSQRDFDRLIGVSGIATRFSAGNRRVKVRHLKKVLSVLGIDFSHASDAIVGLGRNSSLRPVRFPYRLSPLWGELLAHAFFDGYADSHGMRYSNYDLGIRQECAYIARTLGVGNIHLPQNYKYDVGLPEIIPKMLTSIFKVRSFYSKECRIPAQFFHMAKKEPLFGWYFLKGAFLDEGTITGGQIWVVRGLVNKAMVRDLIILCKLLGMKTRLQETKRDYAYSVGIPHASFERFYSNLSLITRYPCKKMRSLGEKIEKHRAHKKRTSNVKADCRMILDYLCEHQQIQTSQIKKLCGVSDLPALTRAKILMKTKNIRNIGSGKKSRYAMISSELPDELPRINKIRRELGWR